VPSVAGDSRRRSRASPADQVVDDAVERASRSRCVASRRPRHDRGLSVAAVRGDAGDECGGGRLSRRNASAIESNVSEKHGWEVRAVIAP